MVVASPGIHPVLQSVPRLSTGADAVRIRVDACALNFADLLLIEGRYQEMPPFPLVPGMEVSGTILEVGGDQHGFAPGDPVVAFTGHGGLAEEVVVDGNRCLRRPETMDAVTGAAFPVAYGTSHLALTRRARIAKGERLVVLGAGGGVGLTAVEIGAQLGAEVIAVARGDAKLDAAKSAGARHLIDGAIVPDLRDAILATGPTDVIYDAVGGAPGLAAARTLAPEGRHLLIGFASGDLPSLKANHMLVKNTEAIGFYWGGYLAFRPDLLTDSLAALMTWHAEGRISPQVGKVLPFDRANEGLELLRNREATGKVVITL